MDNLEKICIEYWTGDGDIKDESIRKAVDLVSGSLNDAAQIDRLRSHKKLWKMLIHYSQAVSTESNHEELEILSRIVMISEDMGVDIELTKSLLYKCYGIIGKSKTSNSKAKTEDSPAFFAKTHLSENPMSIPKNAAKYTPVETFGMFLKRIGQVYQIGDFKSTTRALRTLNMHRRKGNWNEDADRISVLLYQRAARLLRKPFSAAMMYSRSIKATKWMVEWGGKSHLVGILGTLFVERARSLEKYAKMLLEDRIISDLKTGIVYLERSRDTGNKKPINHSMLAIAYSMLSHKTGWNLDYLIEAYENDSVSINLGNKTFHQKANRLKTYFNLLKALMKAPESAYSPKAESYLKMAKLPGFMIGELEDIIEELDAIVEENPHNDLRGFSNYSGLAKIMLGGITHDSLVLKKGIDTLETLANNLPPYLNGGIQHSELGEAWRQYSRMVTGFRPKARALIASTRNYERAMKAGNKLVDLSSYIGSNYFMLGSLVSRNNELSAEETRKMSTKLFERSLEHSMRARENGDRSNHLVSRIADACYRLSVSYLQEGREESAAEKLRLGYSLLMQPDQIEYGHSYIWRAKFARSASRILQNRPQMAGLGDIASYTWQEAIQNIFKLYDNRKISLARLGKGSTGAYVLQGDVASISMAFIIKEFKNIEEARQEHLINTGLNDCLKDTPQGFSTPLALVNHDGKHYLIIERMPYKDLKAVLRETPKDNHMSVVSKAVSSIKEFQAKTTECCKKNAMMLNDPSSSRSQYHVLKMDYNDHLIRRLITGRDASKASRLKNVFREISVRDVLDIFTDRIPYSSAIIPFLKAYRSFSLGLHEPHLESLLHTDMYPGNILESGMIIDPKAPVMGNGLIDLISFLHSPALLSVPDEDITRMIRTYLKDKTGNEDNRSLQYVIAHNALSNIGAKIRQGKPLSAKHYVWKALGALKQVDDRMYDLAFDALYHAGIGYMHDTLLSFNPADYSKRTFGPSINIGIDFDGVIADASGLKIKEFRMHGYEMTEADTSKEMAFRKGISNELYADVVGQLYRTSLDMKLNTALKKVVTDISRYDRIFCITSRTGEEAENAVKYLASHWFPNHKFINTSRQPKDQVCAENNIHILIDDSPKKLQGLPSETMPLLFSMPWNQQDLDLARIDNPSQLYSFANWRRSHM